MADKSERPTKESKQKKGKEASKGGAASAPNPKKRKQPNDISGANSDDEVIGTEIQAEFSFEDFQASDFYGLKNLLASYLDGADAGTGYSASELADLVLEQSGVDPDPAKAEAPEADDKPKVKKVGSVIVVEGGEEEIYGFSTVIDMQRFKTRACTKSILKYVLSKVPTSQKQEWTKILDLESHRIGLLLSERLPNIPEVLALHLTKISLEELKKAGLKLDYYLVVTSFYREAGDDGTEPSKAKKPKISAPSGTAIHYYKLEDEILNGLATLRTSYRLNLPGGNKWTLGNYFTQPSKLIMLFPADRLSLYAATINQWLKEAQ